MDNKKIIKICLMIIAFILMLYIINVFRNCIVINKITKKQEEFAKCDNYLMIVEQVKDESEIITVESYYKDGKGIEITKKNGEKVSTSPLVLQIPLSFSKSTMGDRVLIALTSFISYDEIEGEKCYVVNTLGLKEYFSKDNGMLLKNINDMKYTYKFNEVTDEFIDMNAQNVM